MRGAFICLAAAVWISAASAQQAVVSEDGLGPYHFGMSLAEAEATSQHAAWRVAAAAGAGQILSGGPSLQVGAARFTARFVFDGGALRFIVLDGQAPTSCREAVPALVQSDLEPSFGPFHSVPGPRERGQLISLSATAGGSEIRERDDGSGAHSIFSSRRGGMFIQVKGEPHSSDAQGCRVSLIFNAQAPYAGPLLAPITYEELDHAQTLLNPHWISRPSGLSFEHAYPVRALDAGVDGHAELDCLVNADGSLRCLVTVETPIGGGFGEAALHIAQDFRVLRDDAGASAAGRRVRIPITFQIR